MKPRTKVNHRQVHPRNFTHVNNRPAQPEREKRRPRDLPSTTKHHGRRISLQIRARRRNTATLEHPSALENLDHKKTLNKLRRRMSSPSSRQQPNFNQFGQKMTRTWRTWTYQKLNLRKPRMTSSLQVRAPNHHHLHLTNFHARPRRIFSLILIMQKDTAHQPWSPGKRSYHRLHYKIHLFTSTPHHELGTRGRNSSRNYRSSASFVMTFRQYDAEIRKK